MLKKLRTSPSPSDLAQWARECAAFVNGIVGLCPELPRWTRYALDFADFSAAATTRTIQLFSLPEGWMLHRVLLRHSEEFTGGSLTAYTLEVGITGTLDKYLSAFDVFQAPGAAVFSLGTVEGIESMGGAASIKVTATGTDDNLDAADQGGADVWVLTSGPGEVT